jgi:hypothetical protein
MISNLYCARLFKALMPYLLAIAYIGAFICFQKVQEETTDRRVVYESAVLLVALCHPLQPRSESQYHHFLSDLSIIKSTLLLLICPDRTFSLQETNLPEPCIAQPLLKDPNCSCCVEAECHFYYLRHSSVYVHESCCLGNQRHPLTYVGRRRFWYSPLAKYGS